jgi:putative FmdB family regulatory protein
MPLYEYTCTKCKKKFELIRDLSERDQECECPHCKAKGKMSRDTSLIGSVGSSTGSGPLGSCGPAGSRFT